MQDGEPYLAGTARPAVARVSAATAAAAGVVDGDKVTVSTTAGSVTVPLEVTDMADGVVWLPTNSSGARGPRGPRRRPREQGDPEEGRMRNAPTCSRSDSTLSRLQPADLVDGAAQGRDRLRVPAAHRHLHDLVRAAGDRPDAEPARPQPGRSLGPAAADRRRAEAAAEGGHRPHRVDKLVFFVAPIIAAAPCLRRLRDHPVGPGGVDLPPPDAAAGRRPAGRGAAGAGDELDRRLRHRAGRLGLAAGRTRSSARSARPPR